MAKQKELPENIRQAIDLIAAVIRRINDKRLDNSNNKSLYMKKLQGVAT